MVTTADSEQKEDCEYLFHEFILSQFVRLSSEKATYETNTHTLFYCKLL